MKMVLFAGDMIGSGNCYTFEGCGMAVELGRNKTFREILKE